MVTKEGVWIVEGKMISDEELIAEIKSGQLDSETVLHAKCMKKSVALKDSLYAFYLPQKSE